MTIIYNRTQYVAVGQSVSNTLPVRSGVPQGSIYSWSSFISCFCK